MFGKFDVIIEPQSQRAYAAAYARTRSAVAEDVGLRSWGNDLVGFGNDMFTNWVYLDAETLTQLDKIQRALFAHPVYATFTKETAGIRVNVNTTAVPKGLSAPIAKPSLFDVPPTILGGAKPTRRPPEGKRCGHCA